MRAHTVVDDGDLMPPLDQRIDYVRPDKAASARDDNIHALYSI
jgi:hypothetical protein